MAQISASPPGKRSLQNDEAPLPSDEPPWAKRACLESPQASAHLTLLEELCDLDGDDADSSLRPLASGTSPPQEDLVAEMMKSLEKVIEEGESRKGVGQASTSQTSFEPLSLHDASTDGLLWEQDPSFQDDIQQQREDALQGDVRIQNLLQDSDGELVIPFSSSSSDLDDCFFHEERASLSDEITGPAAVFNLSWLDSSFQQIEETREIYEPVILS